MGIQCLLMQDESFRNVPTVALTATATEKVKADIQRSLCIPDCSHFQVEAVPIAVDFNSGCVSSSDLPGRMRGQVVNKLHEHSS